MLFDWNAVAAPGQVQDVQPCAPLTLTGDGLWVCLVSSGRCTASVPSAGPLPAGAALLLPPQSVPAGHLVLSRAPLVLEPEGSCHLLCVQLTGQASAQFLAGLHELPFLARGETCPAAAELLDRLASGRTCRAGCAASWPLPCCVSWPTPTAPPPPCRRWCRPPSRTSGPTTRACTAWRSSASGWGCPRAIWCAPSPPRWASRRGAT